MPGMTAFRRGMRIMDFGPDQPAGFTKPDGGSGEFRLEPITQLLRVFRQIRAGKSARRSIDQLGGGGSQCLDPIIKDIERDDGSRHGISPPPAKTKANDAGKPGRAGEPVRLVHDGVGM